MKRMSVFVGRSLSALRSDYNPLEQRALVIPPAIPGSLGDAAMISASSESLRKTGATKVDLLYGKEWALDEKIDQRISGERFFYQQSALQEALLVARLPQYAQCYFIGADVIDGAYNPRSVTARISLLAEAARLGKKATLLGASYNKNPETTTKQALRDLPSTVTICARDPRSRTRMESALNRPIRQVADLAFLLKPRVDHLVVAQAQEWIGKRKAAGDQVIGLNANYLHAEKDPNIPRALRILVAHLLRYDISIVLIPHDTRSRIPDQKLLEDATAAVSAKDRERIFMLPPVSPGVVRAVVPSLDFLATGRMHTAILALSGGTPIFCFAYQDKFEGLLQFFELHDADLLSTPAELSRYPDMVAKKIIDKLQFTALFRHQIKQQLPAVIQLAQANFV